MQGILHTLAVAEIEILSSSTRQLKAAWPTANRPRLCPARGTDHQHRSSQRGMQKDVAEWSRGFVALVVERRFNL